jgi:hypothetical protein
MSQIARNISDAVDGLVKGKGYLIHDRDPLFNAEFLSILADSGVKSVKLPPRSVHSALSQGAPVANRYFVR